MKMIALTGLALSLIAGSSANASSVTKTNEVNTVSVQPRLLSKQTIDASDKTTFQFYNLEKGQLVKVAESDAWIFGVRRYIFKTQSGSNGASAGGAYSEAIAGYETYASCEGTAFTPDELIELPGFSISANPLLSNWYDYGDDGAIKPMPNFHVIKRDNECLKFKISSYQAGVYEIEYSLVP